MSLVTYVEWSFFFYAGHRIFVIGGETDEQIVHEEEKEREEGTEEKNKEELEEEEERIINSVQKMVNEDSKEDVGRGSSVVGSYDWKTKEWMSLFSIDNVIDFREVSCVHLEPNMPMKEFDFDRMDWMLQWALW